MVVFPDRGARMISASQAAYFRGLEKGLWVSVEKDCRADALCQLADVVRSAYFTVLAQRFHAEEIVLTREHMEKAGMLESELRPKDATDLDQVQSYLQGLEDGLEIGARVDDVGTVEKAYRSVHEANLERVARSYIPVISNVFSSSGRRAHP